jgi:DNA-binding protein inhibitor ID, other
LGLSRINFFQRTRNELKIQQRKMKAITAVCSTGASVPSIANGRVSRHRDGENAEIQMYISKLKDLVPFMPKNRKLSKLEVITNVIQYICDLQTALDGESAVNDFDAAAALAAQNHLLEQVSPRQPLHVRPSPNTILPSPNNNTSPTLIPASQHIYGTSNEYSSLNHNVSVTQKTSKSLRLNYQP